MEVRVYLRRNLTKLAGAVASGSIKLVITHETFSRHILTNDGFVIGNVLLWNSHWELCIEVCIYFMFIIM